ncbi:MAG: GreA/GreB family elongation factor [Patescibacteria group bacterium]
MRIIPYTKPGFEDLKKKLETEVSKRPEAVKQLTRGRDMGDLSENGLYKAAKQALNDIDRQIRYFKNLIKYAKVYIPQNSECVALGHNVTVETENGNKKYLIVGEYEANPKENKISLKSPIGHNLMGRKVGEEIDIRTPNGFLTYKIIKISN